MNDAEPTPQFPCECLEGVELDGSRRPGKWHVTQRIARDPRSTGGTFSVGYRVVHDDGTEGYLKATDTSFLWQGDNSDPLAVMGQVIQEQTFERDILEVCRGNNMDRIVVALDHGEFDTDEGGVRNYVFFIVFEMAAGDVRTQILVGERYSFAWYFHALHNLATAVGQLHRASISHNDIKPSNLLVFDDLLQKLADVGRATSAEIAGPFDVLRCPGDRQYAAPEQLYHWRGIAAASDRQAMLSIRQASDLYLMGSMAYFFVTGSMLTPMVLTFIRATHQPQNWEGTFEDVLPYWRDAMGAAMRLYDSATHSFSDKQRTTTEELKSAIYQLCEPDPLERGHPLSRRRIESHYDVQRYISLFNRMRLEHNYLLKH